MKRKEIHNLPKKEFSIMIVKMIQDLRKRMEIQIKKIQKMFNEEVEELKNKLIKRVWSLALQHKK